MIAMSPDTAVPPTTDAESGQLASRSVRLGAALLDTLINAAIFIAVGSYVAGSFDAAMAWSKTAPPLQSFTVDMAGFAVYSLLHGYLLATRGQTIGKRLCGIRIVRTDGTPAGLWRILSLRLFPIILLSALPLHHLSNVFTWLDCLLIFRSSHQCLHDQIADTVVVKA
jgi:uncharacterized RDD family membrane protein YckC